MWRNHPSGMAGNIEPKKNRPSGIGQSRTFMLLLKKAHLGEVSATVWPKVLKEMCRRKDIHVIE